MDWFERLTGFREANYEDTRAKLKVDGSRLQSLINGKSYGIGKLELVPLQALRERVKSAGGLPGRLKVSAVTGDVRQMHQSPENAGALFQVASQFNLLKECARLLHRKTENTVLLGPFSGQSSEAGNAHPMR